MYGELKTEHKMLKEVQQTDCKAFEQKYGSLQKCTVLIPTPPYYFIIENFEQYKRLDCRFRSEPFFSHPGGYKMCLLIFPNGAGSVKSDHVSVYVSILRGEYDDNLQWQDHCTSLQSCR